MTTEHAKLVALAKQGNARAISVLLNRSLKSKDITAKVILKNDCLQILLESKQVLNQQALVDFLKKSILGLQSQNIKSVRIYGKKEGAEKISWSQDFPVVEDKLSHSFENFLDHSDIKNTPALPTVGESSKISNANKIRAKDKDSWLKNKAISELPRKLVSVKRGMSKKLRIILLSTSGLTLALLVWVAIDVFQANEKTKEVNQNLENSVVNFANLYIARRETDKAAEGFQKLDDLARNYKKAFGSDRILCSQLTRNWIEDERKKEQEAQQKWEVAFITRIESIKLINQDSPSNEPELYREYLKAVLNRILEEKECSTENNTIPFSNADFSKKYPYIEKVDENSELGYLVFANGQFGSYDSINFQSSSEEYIRSKIDNKIPGALEEGYKMCQQFRNYMVLNKVSLEDAAQNITKENSAQKKEIAGVAIKNLCPQLNM